MFSHLIPLQLIPPFNFGWVEEYYEEEPEEEEEGGDEVLEEDASDPLSLSNYRISQADPSESSSPIRNITLTPTLSLLSTIPPITQGDTRRPALP